MVLFLDDNARPHTERDTKEHIRLLGWERLDNPAYKPDLAPSVFHLFLLVLSSKYRIGLVLSSKNKTLQLKSPIRALQPHLTHLFPALKSALLGLHFRTSSQNWS
ncbi:hypothetical protein AVEN_123155-1 [Araneus ventricosus]|uniref:Tc1-like transposase DDE domain-containing protein n=1 Tax=Araneus ventricosus TaxID=182803 RepID=A0A4Y2W419_ARAVE|nr:hypothetical protein AVEN_123155-1 [Araneus ventricosus]